MKTQLIQNLKEQWSENQLLKELKMALGKTENLDLGTGLVDQIDSAKLSQMLQQTEKRSRPSTNLNWDEILQSVAGPLVLDGTEKLGHLESAYDLHMSNGMAALAFLQEGNAPEYWVDLNNQEFALIPPVVVLFEMECLESWVAPKLTELLQGAREFKIVVLQKQIHQNCGESGRALAVKPELDLGFFALFFRSCYVLQAPSELSSFQAELTKAMKSPRPALISIYDPDESSLGKLALQARAFPYIRFDPEAGLRWMDALDLSLNPETTEKNLAHFLYVQTPESFLPLASDGSSVEVLPLQEWIDSSSNAQPYLEIEGQKYRLTEEVQAKVIMQIQLWEDLKSMGGATSPEGQDDPDLIESRLEEERAKAVLQAMENLSAKLLGVSELSVTLVEGAVALNLNTNQTANQVAEEQSPTSTSVQAKANKIESKLKNTNDNNGESAWIESVLCTACDECTGINPKMFEYNAEKQAILKDPKAGPYADLVKAAEKCSAAIIHPGTPLNLKEKNLAKWVKRANKLELD